MTVRLQVNINDDCDRVLRWATRTKGISNTEVIRQALSSYKFLQDHPELIELRVTIQDYVIRCRDRAGPKADDPDHESGSIAQDVEQLAWLQVAQELYAIQEGTT